VRRGGGVCASALLALTSLSAGCPTVTSIGTRGDIGPAFLVDAGPQGRPDMGPEFLVDAGPMGRPDMGPEFLVDAGPQGRPDMGPDIRMDAGSTSQVDAGSARACSCSTGGVRFVVINGCGTFTDANMCSGFHSVFCGSLPPMDQDACFADDVGFQTRVFADGAQFTAFDCTIAIDCP
jgi:hypothetical protein